MKGRHHYICDDLETEAWIYWFVWFATHSHYLRGSLDNPKGLQGEDHSS